MSNKFYNVVTKKTKKEDTLIEKVSLNKIIERTNKIKNTEKGITVLQLVVTIIVILIIAGVIISFITGKNGVIARADDSKAAWTRASELEQLKLAYSACETDYESLGTPIISEKVGTELKKINPDTKVEDFDMVNENLHDYEITIDRKDETGYAKVTFTQTQHIYIVAVVEVNEITAKYNVTYDANRGEGAPAKQVKIHGKPLTLSNIQPKRLGYTFKGWAKSSSAIYSEYTGGQTYNLDADLSLYAVWTLDEYTITYDLDGGQNSSKNPSGYDIDTPTFYLAEPTKENCIFTGWTGSEITSTTKTVAIRKGTTGNKEYKANWELAYYSVDNVAYTKTLNEAITLAKSGSKIKVLRNSSEVESLKEITGDITLDLAGNTITTASTINIANDSKLTIIDSGNNNEYIGKIKNTVGTSINNCGTLQIGENDGNILNSPYIESKTIGIENTTGSLLFYDGEITAKTAINGDSVTTPSTYYAMSNANAETEDETVTLQTLGTAVCRIGYKYYSTLQKAIDETPSGTYKEEKEEVTISNTLTNNGTYYFEKDSDGKIKSNNKGKINSVANSYIIVDLSGIDSTKDNSIKVNANISSESNCDIGYVTITDSTVAPLYNNTTGQFIKISGNITDKDYTTTVKGGKKYYLHFGYKKDVSVDSGNDLFTINNIRINGTDISNTKINITTQIPVIPENESTITLLNNVTITGSNTTINELKNLNIELGDYILSSSGTNAHIINNGKLKINSKTGKGTVLSSGHTTIENHTKESLKIENTILEQTTNSKYDNFAIINNNGNTIAENCKIIADGNIINSEYGYIEISNSNIINYSYDGNANDFTCEKSKIEIINSDITKDVRLSGNSTFEISGCKIHELDENKFNEICISENAILNIRDSNIEVTDIDNGNYDDRTTILNILSNTKIYSRYASYDSCFICNYGKITIGKDDGIIEKETIEIKPLNISNKDEYLINNKGELNFFDGTISGKANLITGNNINYDKKYSLIDDYDSKLGYYTMYLTDSGVCEIEGNTYKSLEDGINSIENGNADFKTIKMLNSTIINTELKIENKKINLDFNSYSISLCSNLNIDMNSEIKFEDNTETENARLSLNNCNITNNAKLEIENISIYGNTYNIITNNANLKIDTSKIITNRNYNYNNLIINIGNIELNEVDILDEVNDNNYSNIAVTNNSNGEVSIINCNSNITILALNNENGTINVNGGKYSPKSEYYNTNSFLENNKAGTININDCKIEFNKVCTCIKNANGTINIKGKTNINNCATVVYNKSGNTNITGLIAKTWGNSIENEEEANLVIGKNGESIENQNNEINISTTDLNSTIECAGIDNNGNFSFYGGIIKSKDKAIVGPIDEITEGYTINSVMEKNIKYNFVLETCMLNKIENYEYENKKYYNLEDVINDIPENSSIISEVKVENGNIDTSDVNIKNKNIVLDINGNNLQYSKTINIDENSKLKFTDSKFNTESMNNLAFATKEKINGNIGVNNYGKLEITNINLISITKFSVGIYNQETGYLNIDNANIKNDGTANQFSNIKENGYRYIYNIGKFKINKTNIRLYLGSVLFKDETPIFIENAGKGETEIDELNNNNYYYYSNKNIRWTVLNTAGNIIINSMISSNNDYTNIENYDGKITINNGKFSGTINNQKGNEIILNGGIFSQVNNNLNGSIVINNGKIDTSNIYNCENAIYNNIGTIIIGKKDGNIEETPTIIGNQNAIKNESGIIKFYDGVLSGKNTPIIGKITEIEDNSGIETSYNTDKKYYESRLIKKEISEIGDKKYYSLNSALNDAKENDIIKLISNGSELKELNVNKNIIIDLNGFSIDLRNKLIINDSIKCNIIDSTYDHKGTINLYNNGISTEFAKSIENDGELNCNNITIYDYGEYSYQIYNSDNSVFSINSTSIIGKIKNTYQIYNTSTKENNNINDSKISREYYENDNKNNYMIYNISTGTINLNNCSLNSTEDKTIIYIYNENGKMNLNKGEYTYTGSEDAIILKNEKNGQILCEGNNFYDNAKPNNTGCQINIIQNNGNIIVKNVKMYSNRAKCLNGGVSTNSFIGIKNTGNVKYINTDIILNNVNTKLYDPIAIFNKDGNAYILSGNIIIETKTISFNSNNSSICTVGGNIYIGSKGGEIKKSSPIIKSDYIAIEESDNANIYFYDGTISGKEVAIKGEFKEIEPNYQIYTSVDSDGYTNVSLTPIGGTVNVASIGSVNYTSLQDAIASCTTGGESIVLTRDIEFDTSTINIDETKNVTINLNGHTINSSSAESTITNNGTLTIKDTSSNANGSVTNSNGPAIINNGLLNLGINNEDAISNSPKIEGDNIGIENTTLKGILNLYNGKIIGTKAVDGNPINELKNGYITIKNVENNKEVVSLVKQ